MQRLQPASRLLVGGNANAMAALAPLSTVHPRIDVQVRLRSGLSHEFEISEEIFDYMESLRAQGLSGAELCRAWLDGGLFDPPVAVHVSGQRRDGRAIELEVHAASQRQLSDAVGREGSSQA